MIMLRHRLRKDDADKRRRGQTEADKKPSAKTLPRTFAVKPASAQTTSSVICSDGGAAIGRAPHACAGGGAAVASSAQAAKIAGHPAGLDSLGMEAALMSRPLPVLPPLLRRVMRPRR